MKILYQIFYACLLLTAPLFSTGQGTDQTDTITLAANTDSAKKLCVKNIKVTGNKRSKSYIILREMQFRNGDSLLYGQLAKEMARARRQVYNTTLFNEVIVTYQGLSDNDISVLITVKEKWYIYPFPQFELVDRNFNVWYDTYNHSFDRVNYGIKFTHDNLSGRRDQLRIFLINGYSRDIFFIYSNPYSNSKLNRGFAVSAGYSQRREIAYKTSYDNTVLFYPIESIRKQTNDFVRNSWFITASYLMRKGFFKRHHFGAGYSFFKVDDSVINKNHNPYYFKDSVNSKGYLDLTYSFQYANVDNVLYALKGTSAYISVVKRGWAFTGGLNMFSVEAGLNKYFDLGEKWYSNLQLSAKIKLPFDQAYFNQRALGYGETYLRGLEYNVVDGVAYVLAKSTLKRKLFSFNIPFPFFPKIITKIPFTFFAKAYSDFGYVYNQKKFDTYLNNRLLYTGGLGIDVLTLYDINLRFEYSFNQLNNKGLFFHTQNGF